MAVNLWEFSCPFCHRVLEGWGPGGNIAPPPPCPYCGVAWHSGDIHTTETGPPGAHPPETEEVFGLDLFTQGEDDA